MFRALRLRLSCRATPAVRSVRSVCSVQRFIAPRVLQRSSVSVRSVPIRMFRSSPPRALLPADDVFVPAVGHAAKAVASAGATILGLGPDPQIVELFISDGSDPVPPHSLDKLFQIMHGFRYSKVLFASVKLGVYDLIGQLEKRNENTTDVSVARPQPITAVYIASELKLNTDAATRLLNACAGLGLLSKESHEEYNLPDTYCSTPLSRLYLMNRSPHNLIGYINHSNDVLYPLWTHLDHSVRTGSHAWKPAFGYKSSADVFANMYADHASQQRFMRAMHGYTAVSATAVVTAHDLSDFHTMCDVGGGTGALALAALTAYPDQLHAIVYDLPPVIQNHTSRTMKERVSDSRLFANAEERADDLTKVRSRLDWCGGDMFRDPLPTQRRSTTATDHMTASTEYDLSAVKTAAETEPESKRVDLYALSRILHDWDDARCIQLLTKIYSALPDTGRGAVLISERIFKDTPHTGPVDAHAQDLNMLVQTEGRERSFEQYKSLLHRAGFKTADGYDSNIRVQYNCAGFPVDVILAYKPAKEETVE